ncbi:MAG TPA: class I SAM-dependent methyltransferase, partial [Archangium sp.]
MDAPVSFRLNPKHPSVGPSYASGKVPMTTLIEDYIHERLDIEGDFRAFIRERHKVADYKFVADHFKFLFTRFLPEVLIHSQEQDIRIGREHYDRGNDFFGWFLGPRMIYTS